MDSGGADTGMTVAMSRSADTPGIDIVDPIERRRCTLLTDSPVELDPGDPDGFRFPVETAVVVAVDRLVAPVTGHAYVRDDAGDVIVEVTHGLEETFRDGTYVIELTGLVKIYLQIDGAVTITNSHERLELGFEETSTVTIGCRSLHTRPAATVTTTQDPSDLLAAISTFGSALKTTSPERSFPTLRGHPPALELGDELAIPDGLAPPVKDVQIEVPPREEYLYPVAPLAYYLGVAVEPGQLPRIRGPSIDYPLGRLGDFDRTVHNVLKQVFLLECANRTDGLYPVDLAERRRVDERVDIPFTSLYDAPMSERLAAYLEVPFVTIEDVLPDWRLAAHVEPSPDAVSMLPFLADDLALVTMADPTPVPAGNVSVGFASGFTRGAAVTDATFVEPGDGPTALETAWVSNGRPVAATKAVPAAYRNRLGRTPQDQRIEIGVVCNAPEMCDEREVVDALYGTRELLPFTVDVHDGLSCAELAALLGRDFDFLHYIGHIDDDGFRCPDGRLDVADVDRVGADAFFLNACQSYEQGISLIERGAIGGIVTLNEVVNHGAVRIGKAVARLLNVGYPLRVALDVAAEESVIGRQYVVVGDGNLSIVQPQNGTSAMWHVEREGDEFTFWIDGHGAPPGLGCMFSPYLPGATSHHLSSGTSDRFSLSKADLQRFFLTSDNPVRLPDGTIQWSAELDPSDI